MNARTYYLSRLKQSSACLSISTEKEKKIRDVLTEWILFRQYWHKDDSGSVMAEKMDITGDEFAMFIKNCLGDRFLTIRKRLRIDDACGILLDNPDMPIYVAGQTVGIYDKSDFRKIFLQEKGCTPSEWKKYGGKKELIRFSLLMDKARNRFLSPHRS